jgi:hypothetical protein
MYVTDMTRVRNGIPELLKIELKVLSTVFKDKFKKKRDQRRLERK